MREMDLLAMLPEVLHEYREFRAITAAEEVGLSDVWNDLNNVRRDQFIETLTVDGIERWEKMLEIVPPAMDTFEERRFRILARMNEETPYTLQWLKQKLTALCGEGEFELALDSDEYSLKIGLELTSRQMRGYLHELMERVLPANIVFATYLKYNQYFKLKEYTHEQLRSYTHQGLRLEVLPE